MQIMPSAKKMGYNTGFRIRIRMFLPRTDPDPQKNADPGQKVRKGMNKS